MRNGRLWWVSCMFYRTIKMFDRIIQYIINIPLNRWSPIRQTNPVSIPIKLLCLSRYVKSWVETHILPWNSVTCIKQCCYNCMHTPLACWFIWSSYVMNMYHACHATNHAYPLLRLFCRKSRALRTRLVCLTSSNEPIELSQARLLTLATTFRCHLSWILDLVMTFSGHTYIIN